MAHDMYWTTEIMDLACLGVGDPLWNTFGKIDR